MIWDDAYPGDVMANTLDQVLRNAKLLIRERAVTDNPEGWKEHSFYSAGADGSHPLSGVGWVEIHASYAAMVATDCPDGSMHYVKADTDPDNIGLFVKHGGDFLLCVGLSHTQLNITTNDDHTQYYLKDSSKPMVKEVRMDVPVVEDNPGIANDNPMPASHALLSWWAAHGTDGEFIISRHLFSSVKIHYSLKNEVYVHNGDNHPSVGFMCQTSDPESRYRFWPFFEVDNTDIVAIPDYHYNNIGFITGGAFNLTAVYKMSGGGNIALVNAGIMEPATENP